MLNKWRIEDIVRGYCSSLQWKHLPRPLAYPLKNTYQTGIIVAIFTGEIPLK